MERAQLEQLLLQRLEPDTQRVKEADQLVTKFSKQPAALPVLFDVMSSSQHYTVRQQVLSQRPALTSCLRPGSLLPCTSSGLWLSHGYVTMLRCRKSSRPSSSSESFRRLTDGNQPTHLLTPGHSSCSVRGSIAEVCSELAKFLVPSNQWPALMQFLDSSSRDGNADHREVICATSHLKHHLLSPGCDDALRETD